MQGKDGRQNEAQADLELLHALLFGRRFVVLSGAGISTESGIPDYRSPESLKKARKPVQYREFIDHAPIRARYWARSFLGWPRLAQAKPNEAHRALASMERQSDRLLGIITQNVDGLHFAAGSRSVLELHGALARVRCLACGQLEARDALQARLLELNPHFFGAEPRALEPDGDAELGAETSASFRVADCGACGGLLKPDIVFFGENTAKSLVEQAFSLLFEAELLLVLGSSLSVFSGFRFVRRASEKGIPVAIVNLGPTRGDALCRLKVEARLGDFLPRLFSLL